MAARRTTAVRGKWVLTFDAGRPVLLENRYVVIEGDVIAGIARRKPAVDRVIEPPEGLVLPGLINLHNHCIASVLFRGVTEDMETVDDVPDKTFGDIFEMQKRAAFTRKRAQKKIEALKAQ